MQPIDFTTLFARAEQAFVAGRFEDARRDLKAVQRGVGEHPAVLHLLAVVEQKRGANDEARQAYSRALELDPRNCEIATNAGNFYRNVGEHKRSLQSYNQALAANPGHLAALLGRASCLALLGRIDEARSAYRRAATIAPNDYKPWSALGALERQSGDLTAAAVAFDQALHRSHSAPVPVHGRARVALERGESDAHLRFAEAERLLPDDPHAALGAAEAWVPVDQTLAIQKMELVTTRFPDWPDPQSALARLKWERGAHHAFMEGLEAAVAERPHNAAMWNALIDAYSGVERYLHAAEAAARAHAALGDDRFRLLEAANASEAGEMDRADTLFAELRTTSGTELAEARHALKKGQVERAEALLDRAREASPDDIAVWAWTGLVWRLTEDPRSNWLYQIDRLVGVQTISSNIPELEEIAAHISSLHHANTFPIGQSLRGGTQTRGRLFDRADETVQRLRQAVDEVVDAYWSALPREDRSHPLLRHRLRRPRFAGSWSVRLTNGGFHVPHFHPRGVLSSACYLHLPPNRQEKEGWLELGRPPNNSGIDLPPLLRIEPKPAVLVLFPSYLFHGTVPFRTGERLSVAFDLTV